MAEEFFVEDNGAGNAPADASSAPAVVVTPSDVNSSVDTMAAHFAIHPENTIEVIADVLNVVIQGSINWPSDKRQEVIRKALEQSNHPLFANVDEVLKTL